MKTLGVVAALLLTTSTAFASQFVCESNAEAPAYGGSGMWTLSFTLPDLNDEVIENVSLRNNRLVNLGVRDERLTRDPRFVPVNPRYQDHNRYNLADAWAGYSIILPKGLNEIEDRFEGLIYWNGEAGTRGTFRIYCRH